MPKTGDKSGEHGATDAPAKRILIIEDEPLIAEIYRKKFLRRGFDAMVATDGVVGLEKIESWKPDALLLDVMMPRLDGLGVLRRVRENPATKGIPVVMYSNCFSPAIAAEARKLGASHLLSKSETRPGQVLDIISVMLNEPALAPFDAIPAYDRTACLEAANATVAELRKLLKDILANNDSSRLGELRDMTHAFGTQSWLAGLPRSAHLCAALEILLRTLCEHPQYISFSTDKTLLQAVECLERMAASNDTEPPQPEPSILIVDDEEISLQAATYALQKAKLLALCTSDSEEALVALATRSFDLVLLDIDMPKIDGVTLCSNMRAMPHHQKTPVVFFSQLSEIGYRIGSMAAGGNDFIGKPFLSIELSVKALVWLFTPQQPAVAAVGQNA